MPCEIKTAEVSTIQKSTLKNETHPSSHVVTLMSPVVSFKMTLCHRRWITARPNSQKIRTTKGHRKHQCEIQKASYNLPSFFSALIIW